MTTALQPCPPAARRRPTPAVVLLLLGLAGVAALTLTPVGDGWSWGSPLAELRWYAGGLDSTATLTQLLGNLVLLAPAAVAAVLLHPRLARPRLLVLAALGAGTTIEVLQWWLPLGRVVSPADAVLNASGAVLAGLITARLTGAAAPTPTR